MADRRRAGLLERVGRTLLVVLMVMIGLEMLVAMLRPLLPFVVVGLVVAAVWLWVIRNFHL